MYLKQVEGPISDAFSGGDEMLHGEVVGCEENPCLIDLDDGKSCCLPSSSSCVKEEIATKKNTSKICQAQND